MEAPAAFAAAEAVGVEDMAESDDLPALSSMAMAKFLAVRMAGANGKRNGVDWFTIHVFSCMIEQSLLIYVFSLSLDESIHSICASRETSDRMIQRINFLTLAELSMLQINGQLPYEYFGVLCVRASVKTGALSIWKV
jgi:hypothetical protein